MHRFNFDWEASTFPHPLTPQYMKEKWIWHKEAQASRLGKIINRIALCYKVSSWDALERAFFE